MKRDRRQVLLRAVGAVAGAALPAPAIAQGIKELKLVTDWTGLQEFSGHADSAERLAQSITAMSEGRLKVTVYPAGTLVRALETLDAVSAGIADMYHTDEVYFQGRAPALNFFAAVPYGMTADELCS